MLAQFGPNIQVEKTGLMMYRSWVRLPSSSEVAQVEEQYVGFAGSNPAPIVHRIA